MAHRVRITVMRHLPTAGNKLRKYIGWTDEPIIDVGLIDFRLPWQPEEVYGSDLLRTKQSAALYFPESSFNPDWRFRESHFGEWEGKTYNVLKEYKRYRDWIDDPYRHAPPGGEQLQETEDRVLGAFSALPADETDIFLVIHGGPIRLLLTRFSPEKQDFWSWRIPHGCCWQFEWATVLDWKEGKRCASLSAVPITASELL